MYQSMVPITPEPGDTRITWVDNTETILRGAEDYDLVGNFVELYNEEGETIFIIAATEVKYIEFL